MPGAIKGIDDATGRAVANVVSLYRASPGMTRQQVADALTGAFGARRADVVATTEITRAASQATVAARDYLKSHGLDGALVWRTNGDDRRCPVCTPRNGAAQGEGWDEPPPAHPRCRCTFVPAYDRRYASDAELTAQVGKLKQEQDANGMNIIVSPLAMKIATSKA